MALSAAAALAELAITRLSGYDAVIVLQAYAKLEAHVQAAKAAVMAEVGLYEISPCDMKKMAEPDKYSADEVRAALALTHRAAEREYDFSYDPKTRLPQVRAALSTGLIDEPRAMVFRDWLQDAPHELARAVTEHLLPKAGRWTTSQLKDKIKRLLVAADPQWARRRYERAVQQRRVEGVGHADGTATITGHQLPVDQAAAAIGRVDAIARRAKQTGLSAPIDHIRSDVFLGLLDGSLSGLDDDTILAVLLENAANATTTGEEDDFDDQLTDHPGPDPYPGSLRPATWSGSAGPDTAMPSGRHRSSSTCPNRSSRAPPGPYPRSTSLCLEPGNSTPRGRKNPNPRADYEPKLGIHPRPGITPQPQLRPNPWSTPDRTSRPSDTRACAATPTS